MAGQRLTAITVEGFTSIRSARLDLRPLNVLVGANGSGKSNFIRTFELIGRIVDRELGLFTGLAGGASNLLFGGPKTTEAIRLGLDFDQNRYEALLTHSADDRFIFVDERIRYQQLGVGFHEHAFGGGHQESLIRADLKPQAARIARDVIEAMRDCRAFHFHDTSRSAPVKRYGEDADNLELRPDAGNLAAFLRRLSVEYPTAYRRIVEAIRQVAPFFRDFVLVPEGSRIRLRWRQVDQDVVFSADAMSDGTLRFTCLATLLLQPEPPTVIVLDEPELGLHPAALYRLAAMVRAAPASSQLLLATQSVSLLDQFELDDLVVVDRVEGASVFSRPNPDELRQWLDEYSVGDLWAKNLLGGRPRPEHLSS
jgi:predicted ATPase